MIKTILKQKHKQYKTSKFTFFRDRMNTQLYSTTMEPKTMMA